MAHTIFVSLCGLAILAAAVGLYDLGSDYIAFRRKVAYHNHVHFMVEHGLKPRKAEDVEEVD